MAKHIFISYSRADSDQARRFVDELRGSGFTVWQDVSDIRGGVNWLDTIHRGIEEAAVVIILWSSNSAKSDWVKDEIQWARLQKKQIIPVRLDNTPLSADLSMANALPYSTNLTTLIGSFPDGLGRERTDFNFSRPLQAQTIDGIESWEVEGDQLMSVPLLRSSYCTASIVAAPDCTIGQPKKAWICLQFSRTVNKAFISEVYGVYKAEHAAGTGNLPPFVGLHITGPINKLKNEYWLDNENSAHWTDALDTSIQAINELTQTANPSLNIFNLAPSILMFGIGTKLWRFYQIGLYNWIGSGARPPYKRVINLSN